MIGTILRLSSLKIVLVMNAQASLHAPQRLGGIEGYEGKVNDVIYCPAKNWTPLETVVFFGGDVQDYKENMLAHRDNKYHVKWDLESTATLIQDRFPCCEIFVVKPSKMSLKTFSCFENFVDVNNFGAPNHEKSVKAIKHLQSVLQNVIKKTRRSTVVTEEQQNTSNICSAESNSRALGKSLVIIGFSKGCVVLNQILHAFNALATNPSEELLEFSKTIKSMYWLDGGHSGISDTWITDKAVLQNFSLLGIEVCIHVTPYQVMCDIRPRIGKEEKIFRETLRRFGTQVERKLYFEDEPRSLENHFRVLECFRTPH